MSFKTKYCAFLLVGGVLCSANLMAQQVDSTFTDINYLKKSNAWFSSKNASGLKYFSSYKVSSAQLFFNKDNGDFKNYYQSDNSYDFGLDAESFYRLNSKIVFAGGFYYNSFKGKNMGGSGFIDPYKNPFDIVEASDLNKGIKEQEIYRLTGKVGAKLNHKFSVGGSINYETANFAKMKDLRHINKLLDMDLSLGGSYQLNNSIELGLNYNYGRRIESIAFRSYGNTDGQFLSLISFGSFYGRNEVFDKYGYTSSENTRPLTNIGHGGSLQLYFHLNKNLKLFNEFTYTGIKGNYGEEGTANVLLTEHIGTGYEYNGAFSILRDKNQHHITLKAAYQDLSNNENIYREETTPGGVSRIVYLGQNETLDKSQLNAGLGYTLFRNVEDNNPTWVVDLKANYFRRIQTTILYPFYRDQTIDSYQVNAVVKKNIVKVNNMYSIALGGGYGTGSGVAQYDGLYATPSASQMAPKSMDLYLYQEFEYFTKPRVSADISLQYTRKLKQNIAPYFKLSYSYTKAFDTDFLVDDSFKTIGLSVGCSF